MGSSRRKSGGTPPRRGSPPRLPDGSPAGWYSYSRAADALDVDRDDIVHWAENGAFHRRRVGFPGHWEVRLGDPLAVRLLRKFSKLFLSVAGDIVKHWAISVLLGFLAVAVGLGLHILGITPSLPQAPGPGTSPITVPASFPEWCDYERLAIWNVFKHGVPTPVATAAERVYLLMRRDMVDGQMGYVLATHHLYTHPIPGIAPCPDNAMIWMAAPGRKSRHHPIPPGGTPTASDRGSVPASAMML